MQAPNLPESETDEAFLKSVPRAVIFDLDGTLLYTLENLFESTNHALRAFGYKERSMDEIRSFVGNGVRVLMQRAMPAPAFNSAKLSADNQPNLCDKDFEACLAVFKEHYAKTMYEKTRPYDGVIEILETLRKSGAKRAVVSNKFDSAVKALCNKYFGDLLITSVGESETVRKKPAPDGVLKVMKELGCKPYECVYIGDSEVDIETAKNAEVECISVDWGYKDEEFLLAHGAKKIAHTPAELLDMILNR